ncbi:FAD-binding protein [Polaromonas sp. P1(28)-13]|nr:FAD-binding protein [Polaromonas sp. P1(28)-13]
MRLIGRHLSDRLSHSRGTRLVLGNALIARLVFSLRQAGVDIRMKSGLVDLVKNGTQVVGATVESNGQRQNIRAWRGVVLATGGCAASGAWRTELCGRPVPHTLTFEGCTGEGLQIGMKAGAHLDKNNGGPFFWMPASVMHWPGGRVAVFPHIRDRPKPGVIAVKGDGRRFVNEGNSYHDFVSAMFKANIDVAHLVCDRNFIKDYGLGVIHPRRKSIARFIRSGYLIEADTLAELAARIGVDPVQLAETVNIHNRDALTGVDTQFGKGSTALNRYNGDGANKPNPCLRPIETGPFYALAVHPAPIGSSTGLSTDVHGQVLDESQCVINGLYACGNDMSSIMRGHYPGPGITLGPALVFAYRLACHAAGQPQLAAPVPTFDTRSATAQPLTQETLA